MNIPHPETHVVGAAVYYGTRAADKLLAIISTPDVFTYPKAQQIFQAIQALRERNQPVDMITVAREMETKTVTNTDAFLILAEIVSQIGTAANFEFHCAYIIDQYTKRRSGEVADMMKVSAKDRTLSGSDIVDKAITEIENATNVMRAAFPETLAARLQAQLQLIETRAKEKSVVIGLRSSLSQLDDTTRGFRPKQYVVLAGRPAMGKTSLGLQIIHHTAKQNLPCLFISQDQSEGEILNKLFALETGQETNAIDRGINLDWDAMNAATARLTGYKLDIQSNTLSVQQIKAYARRWNVNNPGHGMILVDFIQRIPVSGLRDDAETVRVSMVSKALKDLARETGKTVLALSQITRESAKRPDPTPTLTDLAQSGAIEADADIVIFMHRPWYYLTGEEKQLKESEAGITQIIVAKNKVGGYGFFECHFDMKRSHIADRVQISQPPAHKKAFYESPDVRAPF